MSLTLASVYLSPPPVDCRPLLSAAICCSLLPFTNFHGFPMSTTVYWARMAAPAYGKPSLCSDDTPLPVTLRRHKPVRSTLSPCTDNHLRLIVFSPSPPPPLFTPPVLSCSKSPSGGLPRQSLRWVSPPLQDEVSSLGRWRPTISRTRAWGRWPDAQYPSMDTNHDRSSLDGGMQACGSGEGCVEKVTVAGTFVAFSFCPFKREIGKHGGGGSLYRYDRSSSILRP